MTAGGPEPQRVLLVGMMGVGKSTVGRALARRLGWAFVDTDAEVRRRTGLIIPELFATRGEAAFRAEEAAAVADACAAPDATVVSVGGGAVLDPATRARLARAGSVVWLRASVATVVGRVGEGGGRPLLAPDPAAAIAVLVPQRAPLYAEVATVVIDVDGHTPEQCCADVVAALGVRA